MDTVGGMEHWNHDCDHVETYRKCYKGSGCGAVIGKKGDVHTKEASLQGGDR